MVKFRAVFVIMVSVGPGIGIGHGVNARTMLKFRSRIVGRSSIDSTDRVKLDICVT